MHKVPTMSRKLDSCCLPSGIKMKNMFHINPAAFILSGNVRDKAKGTAEQKSEKKND